LPAGHGLSQADIALAREFLARVPAALATAPG
jgi:hypothetical protein